MNLRYMKQITINNFSLCLLVLLFCVSAVSQETFPVIELGENSVKCYSIPFNLHTVSESNPTAIYNWEYGIRPGYDAVANPGFNNFLVNVSTRLKEQFNNLLIQVPGEFNGVNIDLIILLLRDRTDYSFMKDYLYLYEDILNNKGTISDKLMLEIINQNYILLNPDERQFIYSFFPSAVFSQSDIQIPYNLVENDESLLTYWRSFGLGVDEIQFDPRVSLPQELTDRINISFRIRGYNFTTFLYNRYSNIVSIDIVPSPPTSGPISSTSSCLNKNTGQISFSIATSAFSTSQYLYKIVGSNESCSVQGEIGSFIGNNASIGNVGVGSKKLCLKYSDGSVGFFYSEKTFEIETYNELSYSVVTADVSCPGAADGTISVNITNGAGGFWINLNSGTNLNGAAHTFSGLAPGNYIVKVGDLCKEVEVNKMITQPASVTIVSVTPRQPTCISTPDGGFEIKVTGGTNGQFDYYIRNSEGTLIKSAISQSSTWSYYLLPEGNYTLNVRDNGKPGCSGATSSVSLINVVPLSLSSIKTDVKCFGQSTGAIQLTGTGGSLNYKFKIGAETKYGNVVVFNFLTSATYTVFMSNNNSCGDIINQNVTIETNPKLEITLSKEDVTCFDEGNGLISSSISGGYGNYDLLWEEKVDNIWQYKAYNVSSISLLEPGDYRLKVTDDALCEDFKTETIVQPTTPITINGILPLDVKCKGESGSIEIFSNGGTGGYTYSWLEEGGLSYVSANSSLPLPAGKYSLKAHRS